MYMHNNHSHWVATHLQLNILLLLLFLTKFRDFFTLDDGTDRLVWKVGKGLPLYAVLYPETAQISWYILTYFVWLQTKHVCFISWLSSYRAVNILHLGYTNPTC
jgi:hypothetical protein